MIRIDELLRAYRKGFFPMSDPKDGQVFWCQPYKRAVFHLDSYKPSKDVLRLKRKNEYRVTFDEEFEDMKKKVKLSPIPEAILRVYRRIFK